MSDALASGAFCLIPHLGIGPAEEVIVVTRARSSDGQLQPMEIDSYWFTTRGKTYNFSCVFPTSLGATYTSICRSAGTSLHLR